MAPRFTKFSTPSRPELPAQQLSSSSPTTSSPKTVHSAITQVTVLLASPALPSAAVSLASQCTPSTSSRAKGVAWQGVKLALVLLKESSDPYPPLKGALGGLVALIDTIELAFSNVEELDLLRQKIDSLNRIIKDNSRDTTFPWLRRRCFEFAEKLNGIVEDLDGKSGRGTTIRILEGKKDKEDMLAFTKAISDLITNLQFELTLYVGRGIHNQGANESLKKLKASEAAQYNASLSAELVQRRSCTPKTREKILDDLMKWAKNSKGSRTYWLNGMAGTGKTTIAYSFCERLREEGLLGANFFCSRSLAECSDIRYIIPTIASHLARSCPQFTPFLLEVIGGDFQLSSLRDQFKRLLLEPFHRLSEPVNDTLTIVIDALDECSNEASEIRLFLKLILDSFSAKSLPLKILVTSRPEKATMLAVTPPNPSLSPEWSILHIHEIEELLVQADITLYVEDELAKVADTWGLEGWPPRTEVDLIVGNAKRLFIYAATVIRYVKEDSGDHRKRLSEMASISKIGKGTSQNSSLTMELIDGLYRTIVERALHKLNQDEKLLFRMVLKLIVCAQTPLTLVGIADLLNASGEFDDETSAVSVSTTLKLLHSVVSAPMDGDGVVAPFHVSFPDFLFDSQRCGSTIHIPHRQSHREFARTCFYLMDKSLTIDNISKSDQWQNVDDIIKDKKVERYIPNALAYACMFWGSHIETDDEIESLSTELDRFLSGHVLRWLEALGLLRRLDIGVEVLRTMKACKHPIVSAKFDDMYKFLKDVLDIISVWPCQVFYSGLIWAPEQSFIRKMYPNTQLTRIVRGRRAGWGACEHTIRGHASVVKSVVMSADNHRIVSGSDDGSIRIWNASTGEEEQTLHHSSLVHSVAISPDNRSVVAGYSDGTARIWSASTGEEKSVLRGHSSSVVTVAVSPDSRHVVSGSLDGTVRIWNASTGGEERVLSAHSGMVGSVAVSPDNRCVVFGSYDETVRIWNVSTGEEEHVLRGHSKSVTSVAVSPDSRHIVSGSYDATIRIWNASTGEEERVLQHSSLVLSVAVSHDNRRIISGCNDYTIRIWNASTGEEEYTLRGHSRPVTSVAVSPDSRHIVSGSYDATIRIWNASTGEEEDLHQGHSDIVKSLAVSSDHRLVVSGSHDKTVRIWNASTGGEERVLQAHSGMVSSVVFSPDNRRVVFGSEDKTVRIWDVSTGEEEHVLWGNSDMVRSVAVSADNRRVAASGLNGHAVRIWSALTGEEEHVLEHCDRVTSLAFSPDGSHIVSGSSDATVRIWNASTGENEHVFRGHSHWVTSVAVSLDNHHVVSGSQDNTIRIWNVSTDGESPLVLSFTFSSSDHCRITPGLPIDSTPNSIGNLFISSMVNLSAALFAQGGGDSADTTSAASVMARLVAGESVSLDDFLQAGATKGLLRRCVPVTLTLDKSAVLLSDGRKCLAVPSALRDISCVGFAGSVVCFGYPSGRLVILDISESP